VSLARVLDLVIWCPVLVLAFGILHYVEKGATPLVGQLGGWEMAEVFFPLLSLVLYAVCYKQELKGGLIR
jgi:hypothetical protein